MPASYRPSGLPAAKRAAAHPGRRIGDLQRDGKRVLADLAPRCPVGGVPVLRRAAVICQMCGQVVSPAVVRRGRCTACRNLQAIAKTDPRLARLLHEHPELDGWSRWRMGETAAVYILVAAGWLKRLLLTVDKETLELKRVAVGSRLQSDWNVVNPTQYRFALSG